MFRFNFGNGIFDCLFDISLRIACSAGIGKLKQAVYRSKTYGEIASFGNFVGMLSGKVENIIQKVACPVREFEIVFGNLCEILCQKFPVDTVVQIDKALIVFNFCTCERYFQSLYRGRAFLCFPDSSLDFDTCQGIRADGKSLPCTAESAGES